MALRIWLPLNGNLENKGISDVTVTSGNVTIDNNGKIGQCYLINGTRSYIQCLFNNFNISEAGWSFCFWIYPQDLSRWNCLLSFIRADGQNYFYLEKDGTFSYSGYSSSIPSYGNVELNKWQHITISFLKAGGFAVYKNGEFLGVSRPETVWLGNLIGIKINSDNSSLFGKFKINDVRLYDHCLSAKEVKEISQGLILHYKLDGFSGGAGENILPNTTSEIRSYEYPSSSFKDQFAVITTKIPEAEKYTLSFYAKSTVAGDKIRAHYYSPNTTTTCVSSQGITKTASDGNIDFTLSTDWQLYWVTYTQTSTTAVKHVILPRMGAVGNTNGVVSGTGIVSIKCVKMEEGEQVTSWTPALSEMGTDTSKITDSSGYGNDGIITGNLIINNDSKRYMNSTTFNGSSNISLTNFHIGNEWSYGCWVYSQTSSRGWEGIIILNSSGGDSDTQLGFYTNPGGNRIQNTANGQYNSGIAMTYGQWNHFFGTFDGSNLKTYINGVLVNTKAITNTLLSKINLTIGARSSNANGAAASAAYPFLGQLSDIRIYATALSAEDILDLYHTPVNVDNLQNIHTFEFRENGEKISIYQNGITSTTDEIHESNAELLNTMSIGGYTPAKNTANSCTSFGYANFDNYAFLGQDLAVHIECDVEWTAFTADTGGTFRGVWFQGANYEKASSSFKWAGTNYICSALNSAFSLQTISTITTAGKHRYDITTTIPASWFATYSRSDLGWRCDYSDGTGHIDIKNLKITPLQYYNAKIGENFISANIFIEK